MERECLVRGFIRILFSPKTNALLQQVYPALEVVNGPSGIDVGFQAEAYPGGGPG